MRHLIPMLRASALGPLVVVGLGALLTPSPARAADLDPGYADIPAPIPQQNVTFGSGWYVRGDIGVTKDYGLDVAQLPLSKNISGRLHQTQNAGYDLSLGAGYSFTNNFRGDVSADFHQPITTVSYATYCYMSRLQRCDADGRFDSYDALINGYYDFGAFGAVTPYVGAGVGVGFGHINTHLYDAGSIYTSDATYHSLAWALMAGIAIDVYAHTKLDIGYRFLNNGNIYGTNVYRQEIRAGLRYMIDN